MVRKIENRDDHVEDYIEFTYLDSTYCYFNSTNSSYLHPILTQYTGKTFVAQLLQKLYSCRFQRVIMADAGRAFCLLENSQKKLVPCRVLAT